MQLLSTNNQFNKAFSIDCIDGFAFNIKNQV